MVRVHAHRRALVGLIGLFAATLAATPLSGVAAASAPADVAITAGGAAAAQGAVRSTAVRRTAAATTLNRRIADPRVIESSGLARSTYARSTLFTHNDSGDTARVFAIAADGSTSAVLTLAGVAAEDMEDVASGPGHRLWLADIGDNSRDRATISVYRFDEPETLSSRTVTATRFRFRYPDGRHDAEAFLVNPRTGRLFVVSKAASGARVYRAPATLSPTQVNVLGAVAPAPSMVTAGSWAPGGLHLALGNYRTAYVYRHLGHVQRTLALPSTTQGESLEFGREARTLFRGSEGSNSPVFAVPTT